MSSMPASDAMKTPSFKKKPKGENLIHQVPVHSVIRPSNCELSSPWGPHLTPSSLGCFVCPLASHPHRYCYLLLFYFSFCSVHDQPLEECSRPSRPCICVCPSRFQPLAEHSAARESLGPWHRACGISPGERPGSRVRSRSSLHTATPAGEGQ